MLRDDEKGGLRALAGDLGVSRSVELAVYSSAYAHTNVDATSCKAPEVLFARHGDVLKYKPQPVDVWGAGESETSLATRCPSLQAIVQQIIWCICLLIYLAV